ncbi:MAG: 6-pyruvoyl-tetrahydropterin synthase-related protein [Candidatus Sulfotelmatobacter sp.]
MKLKLRREANGGSLCRLTWAPLLSIAAAAFAVEIPFFFRGTPSGHDLEFHLYSWLEILSQWKRGVIYPRWAALAHFGYGEPRFIFYPPASWTLGAMLSAMLPWTIVADVYVWLALLAAGVSIFLLARQWFDRRDATFAAVLYAVNPYHLVIVYWRSAFAELLAASLLPLLLLLVLRAGEKRRGDTLLLGVLLACAWLVNAPAALMIHYSMALLLLVIAWRQRSARVLLEGCGAVLLGAALTSFYLLPAIYEQRWVNIARAVSAGSRPLDNFLFVHTTDLDHDKFNRVISWVAIAELLLTTIGAWAAWKWRRVGGGLWISMVIWATACVLLMLPVSNPLWSVLPKLVFMQFPWRWLLCLGVPFTLLITMGVRRWAVRLAFYVATLCVIGFVWHYYQPPWWDTTADLREMQDNMTSGVGYEGTDEYMPAGADSSGDDSSRAEKNVRSVTVEGSARAAIHVQQWGAESRMFTAEMSAADNLQLHLFNYPAWRVEVNGRQVRAGTREGTGQMLVPVQAGANRVRMTFIRTWDRVVGAWISAISLVIVLLAAASGA